MRRLSLSNHGSGNPALVLGLIVATLGSAAPAPSSIAPALPSEVVLKFPAPTRYQVSWSGADGGEWVEGHAVNSRRPVWFGRRIVLEVEPGVEPAGMVAGRPLRLVRTLSTRLAIYEAPDAPTALVESVALGGQPGVRSSRPVMRRGLRLHGPVSPRPNDPLLSSLWHLENRAEDGTRLGIDLNARAAWFRSRGEGVVLAVVDDGVEVSHPEFVRAGSNSFHFSFVNGTTNGLPTSTADLHATLVAGFAVAAGDNGRGIIGMAPGAQLASWKIFLGDTLPLSDEEMMDMFQYLPQDVGVRNHSWGNSDYEPLGPTSLEELGIAAAVTSGRQGRGVVMVRSGGNGRQDLFNVNDDGYASDPRVITVAAVTSLGRAADYSQPGACLLVSAFGGGSDRALTTTDRQGSEGLNWSVTSGDDADYYSATSLRGTSFAAPQVSGLVALLLSINPALTFRDVQHILVLSSRNRDLADPDAVTNAAGLVHSHQTGFGIPDAGIAGDLAYRWSPRPPRVERRFTSPLTRAVPDDGMRVLLSGLNVPLGLRSIPSTPGTGPHADDPLGPLPLVDIGLATNSVSEDLEGKAALIQRGPAGDFPDERNTFRRKIENAAAAGAVFAVLYNNVELTNRFVMGDTDFVPIPAVMISQTNGEALRDLLPTDPMLSAQLSLSTARTPLTVNEPLLCEHVGVRLQMTHSRRADVRVTLLSPRGSRSVLQHVNFDTASPPADWTYWSTRHFGESSLGAWTIDVSDQAQGSTGSVTSVELILTGVPITDSDGDGLDDAWEQGWFGTLAHGPQDDPDGDDVCNARERWLNTDPSASDAEFRVWYSPWSPTLGRLAWTSRAGQTYGIESTLDLAQPFATVTNRVGEFPETEWFTPLNQNPFRLFRVRSAETSP